MVARDIVLAETAGLAVHIAHLATAGAVRMVGEAKARGVRVTAEATPHHLLLTEEALATPRSGFQDESAPPDGRRCGRPDRRPPNGTIDAVATDHAPHTAAEKIRGLSPRPRSASSAWRPPSPSSSTASSGPDVISLGRFVELLSTAIRPACSAWPPRAASPSGPTPT